MGELGACGACDPLRKACSNSLSLPCATVGHRRPGTLPHHHQELLPRRRRHCSRVRRRDACTHEGTCCSSVHSSVLLANWRWSPALPTRLFLTVLVCQRRELGREHSRACSPGRSDRAAWQQNRPSDEGSIRVRRAGTAEATHLSRPQIPFSSALALHATRCRCSLTGWAYRFSR